MLGVHPLTVGIARVAVDEVEQHQAAAEAECRLDGVGQPLLRRRLHRQPVDHDLDRVFALFLQLGHVGEGDHVTVDARPGEPLGLQVREEVDIFALAAPHDRGEHLEPGALGQLQQAVDDLLRGLAGDRPAALRAVWPARPREHQAQVVVHLGDRPDRRPGVSRGRFLIDGDRR